jgi:hypothetical protein
MKLTISMLLKGRNEQFPKEYTKEIADNLELLRGKVQEFLKEYSGHISISSGWRPAKLNDSVGGATKSLHITGHAVDIIDTSMSVWNYVLDNLELAKSMGLYFEDKRATPSWVHIQTLPPKSGKRIFKPNSNPWQSEKLWSGVYDHGVDNV